VGEDFTALDSRTSVYLIDRQATWRHRSTQALEAHGYLVQPLDTYEYPPVWATVNYQRPDLVVLACANVGPEEQQLIQRVVENGHPLVVLCSLLTSHVMRMLFLAGVTDVAVKPYDDDGLVEIVSDATATLAQVRMSGF